MRLAFVSFETVHHRQTETNARFHALIELVRDAGHEVHVCCAQWWPGVRDRLSADGIEYHGVSEGLSASESFFVRLPFVLAKIRPDVIHTTGTPPSQVIAARSGATLARAPLITEWYGEDDITDGRTQRLAAARPDRIITPSRLVGTWIRERGASEDQVRVIPNHISTDQIQETPPDDPVDIVYSRRLDGDANLESLLLGLAELRDREWSAAILGDGPERETYELLSRDLRIDDRVTFRGVQPMKKEIAAYRSAHVFVQTARRCVFPSQLLWALAAGCVGIVEYQTDSSAHELVEGRSRGFRVTSEQELADAIIEAGSLEHRTYDEDFETFDQSAVLEQYLETYRTFQ